MANMILKGFKGLWRSLAPPVIDREMRIEVEKALDKSSLQVVAAIRRSIQSGSFAQNAELTQAIKGSDKALVDSGQLFQSITFKRDGDLKRFIGVTRNDPKFSLAAALHAGTTIKVTEKMRGMFFLLWLASIGSLQPSELTGRARALWRRRPGGWKPLDPSTTTIRIPARPFVARAFQNKALRKQFVNNVSAAVNRVNKRRALAAKRDN